MLRKHETEHVEKEHDSLTINLKHMLMMMNHDNWCYLYTSFWCLILSATIDARCLMIVDDDDDD